MIAAIHKNLSDLQINQNRDIKNYTLVDVAVSDFNGKAEFNVAGQMDWGCSSLGEFSENLELTWPGRIDFKVTHTLEVDVIRLDRLLSDIDFKCIQFLHCDTQGSDLSVLRGLGKYRDFLKRGVVECATSKSCRLYKEQHVLEDLCYEFVRWGFEI
jgi:FkbM family methyltransferase